MKKQNATTKHRYKKKIKIKKQFPATKTTGPAGQSVPAQVHQTSEGIFKAEFVPRVVGEHRVNVTVNGLSTAGSPYAAKVGSCNCIATF